MNIYKKLSFLILLFALTILACRKDEINMTKTTIPPTPEIIVNASLSGQVVDELGEGLSNVVITVESNEFTTDENGFFLFNNINMNSYGTYIKAEKTGYFLGAKFIEPQLNGRYFTRIKLLEKALTASINANSGGAVTTTDGVSITFPSNGIKKENGENYSGSVNVFAKWLNPSSDDILETMPGDLRATDESGEFVQLATFGMIAVELESPTGEALNIADDYKAKIEVPVPNDLLDNAPSTIPLWHFDENTGYWREEGQATLQENKYVGEVSHFSFWNCDFPSQLVQLSGNINDVNGNGLEHILVKVTANSTSLCGYGTTNSDGFYTGKVPKNEELTLEVLDKCGDVIHSQIIPPSTDDIVLSPIAVTIGNPFLQFSAVLKDCNDEPVSFGYVKVKINEEHYSYLLPSDQNGVVDYTLFNCDDDMQIEVKGYDLNELKESENLTFDITGLDELDAGDIDICDDLVEYLHLILDGNSRVIVDPLARLDVSGFPGIYVDAWLPDTNFVSFIIPDEITAGIYTPSSMQGGVNLGANNILYGACSGATGVLCTNMEITITNVEAVGGFIEGSFIGQLPNNWDNTIIHDLEGDFRIIIE